VLWITSLLNFDQTPRKSQRKGALAVCSILCTLGLSVSASTQEGATLSTFDPPGSTQTRQTSINPDGVITGYFYDTNHNPHGFLRARDGTFTTFDAPAPDSYPPGSFATFPASINPEGAITGYYESECGFRVFLRARDGTFITLDPPGFTCDGNEFGPFWPGLSINPEGTIAVTVCDGEPATDNSRWALVPSPLAR
jgi:hypothetical protein